MADVYVYHGGSGTGASWATAYTTLGAAFTAKAAGDTFWVAHDHVETAGAAKNMLSPGSETNPCRVYCVNRAGSVPPVAADLRTTAQITTTGAFAISLGGTITECYGIIFSSSDAATQGTINVSSVSNRMVRLVNCTLRIIGTSVSGRINLATSTGGCAAILENTTVQFANVSQIIQTSSHVVWRNTPSAIVGATIPTALFQPAATPNNTIFLEGVDLSALGSGKTVITTTAIAQKMILKDCKLGASVTIVVPPASSFWGSSIDLIRCDSGDTNYRTERYNFMGTLTTETTIIHTGGASDGTTPIAWKIDTTANSRWEAPFECLPISIWNETVGSSVTVTIEGIWGGGAVPLNSEIWIECQYLGTSGFPLASKATSGKANGLETAANIPAGSGTWGGSTTKFAMSATMTPQEKGPITIYVRAAKVSSTFYIDPKPVIT